MGLFLNVLIVPDRDKATVKNCLDQKGDLPGWELKPSECQYKDDSTGTMVLLNDWCSGYADIPKAISQELHSTALLCYIYDGDFWGYFLYQNGMELDRFTPMPSYFEEISEDERQRCAGSSQVLAQCFQIPAERVERYLQEWTDEILESDQEVYAYEGDESPAGQDWQMTDFMNALGFPYPEAWDA